MSTGFRTEKRITFEELFDGRLNSFGIKEEVVEGETDAGSRLLFDGQNYMWAYGDEAVSFITSFGRNNPNNILSAIAETFETEIFSEEQPQYWGFETEEEQHNAWKKINEQYQAKFYVDIMKHIRGEPNNISPNTIGMTKANIAKALISEDPGLASPDRKTELMEEISKEYDAHHCC